VFAERLFASCPNTGSVVNPRTGVCLAPRPAVWCKHLFGRRARPWPTRSPNASARSWRSSSSTSASGGTRPRCARSARRWASPPPPRSTRTWPRCSGWATCSATPPSRVRSRGTW